MAACSLLCVAALPFRKPPRKPAAVARPTMPGRVYRPVIGHQQHHVEAFGAAQRIDRLLRGLRDRTCDINEVLTEISTPMWRPSALR